MRSRQRSGFALAVTTGLVVALLGPAWAQESEPLPDPLEPVPREEVSGSFPIDDGTYTGRLGLGGSFWFGEQGLTVVWRGSSSGPLQFTVADGELDGTWSLAGEADITGAGRWERGHSTDRPGVDAMTLTPREALRRFWVDTVVHDPSYLRHLIATFGLGAVMLGSDWPFPMGADSVEASLEGLAADEVAAISIENALRLLEGSKYPT